MMGRRGGGGLYTEPLRLVVVPVLRALANLFRLPEAAVNMLLPRLTRRAAGEGESSAVLVVVNFG